MTGIPNGLFSNAKKEKLARNIIRKLAMNTHDKTNPATLAIIKNYFAASHSNIMYKDVLSKLISSSVPLHGSIPNDEFYLGDRVLKNPMSWL